MLRPVFALLLLPAVLSISTNINEETRVLPGIILYHSGEVNFIEGYLDLIVSLECPSEIKTTIYRTTKMIDTLKDKFLPAFNDNFINISINQRAHKWEFQLIKIRTKVISLKLIELKSLPWIHSQTRYKRAAFELGGDILNILFGTATDKQIKFLRKKINILGNFASTSNLLVNELKEQLKSNTRTLSEFQINLQKLIEFQNRSLATHNILNQLGSIKSLLTLVEHSVNSITMIHQLVITSLQLAKNKITNDQLYSPIFLLPYILEMTQTTKLHPIIPLEATTYHSFLTYSWTIKSTTNPFELITLIPFISNEKFISYKLIPFPTFIPFNETSVRIMYNTPNNYLFVNYGQRKYTYLRNSIHDYCRNIGKTAVCPQSQPFTSIDDKTCLLSLLLNYTTNFSSCPITIFKSKEPFTVTLGHFTIISFAEKIRASISCERPHSVQHMNNFIFNIPHGCTFTSANYQFKNPIHLEKNISLTSLIAQSDKVLFNFLTHVALPNISSALFPKFQIMKEVQWNKRLDSINNTIHPLTPYLSQVKLIPYIGGGTTSVILFIFIIVIIYLTWSYRKALCRKCLKELNQETQDIPLNNIPMSTLPLEVTPVQNTPQNQIEIEPLVQPPIKFRQSLIPKPPMPPPIPYRQSTSQEVELYSNIANLD